MPLHHFPDSRIGASLKLYEFPHRREVWYHFPDSRIGASLKRRTARLRPADGPVLPRFANRGLIEASRSTTRPDATGRLPRFANRGLIEARLQHIIDGGNWNTSPIRESGPH